RHDLQEPEVAGVRETRRADERDRARLRRDDREHERPPGDAMAGDEVVRRVALAPPQVHPERRDAREVRHEHRGIEPGERAIHRGATTYASIAKYSASPSRSSHAAGAVFRASPRCESPRSS